MTDSRINCSFRNKPVDHVSWLVLNIVIKQKLGDESKKMANIIQWNIGGFYKRNTDIQRIQYTLQSNMFCFQETNLKTEQICHLKNYTGYFENRIISGRVN